MLRTTMIAWTVGLLALVPLHAQAQCEIEGGGAEIFADYCDPTLTWEGCCDGLHVFWCDEGVTCRLSCASRPQCGWLESEGYYWCQTEGGEDPSGTFPLQCPDADGDSWHIGGDCDDTNPDVSPSDVEQCDGVLDNNCDGTDDGNEIDDDLDGFTECDGDCNDADADFYPGADDICGDGIDHDCDEDFESEFDADEDGFPPCAGDCDEERADRNPGETEVCDDGFDNDCDELADAYDPDCEASDDDDDDDTTDPYDPRGGPYGMRCGADSSGDPPAAALLACTALTLALLRRRLG